MTLANQQSNTTQRENLRSYPSWIVLLALNTQGRSTRRLHKVNILKPIGSRLENFSALTGKWLDLDFPAQTKGGGDTLSVFRIVCTIQLNELTA